MEDNLPVYGDWNSIKTIFKFRYPLTLKQGKFSVSYVNKH
jgi:hypothetical protein